MLETSDEMLLGVSKAASYGAATGATIFGLSLNEFAVAIGMIIAVCTYLTSLYFQAKHDKREDELFKIKKGQLGAENGNN